MTKMQRWIATATQDAANCTIKLPWERGLRREAFIKSRALKAAPAVPQQNASSTAA